MKARKLVIFLLFFLFFIFAFFLWEFKSINVNNREHVETVENSVHYSRCINQLRAEIRKAGIAAENKKAADFHKDSAAVARTLHDPWLGKNQPAVLQADLLALKEMVSGLLQKQSVYLNDTADGSIGLLITIPALQESERKINSAITALNNLQEKQFSTRIASVEDTHTRQYLLALGFAILSFLIFYFLLTGLSSHIQRRKSAEIRAFENEIRYKRIIDESGVVIFTTNIEGRFTFVNEMTTAITGFNESELLSMYYLDLVEPAWRDDLQAFYTSAVLNRLTETQHRFPIRCKNGEIRWVEQTAVIVTRDGKPDGFHCITKDITESYQLEKEKNYLHQLFQSIMDNSPQAIFIKSLEGKYIHVNKKFCALLNLPEDKITGHTDEDLFDPGSTQHYRHKELQVIRTSRSFRLRQQFNTPSGVRTFSIDLFPLFDFNQAVLGVSGIATDITDAVQNKKNLIAALKRAETAEKHTQTFLANMSHEIRTPLNSIIGLTYQLLKSDMRPKEHGFVQTINAASEHLLVLINDILDTSKIEAGKLTLEKTGFSFRELISLMTEMLRQKAEEKNIRLLTELDETLAEYHIGDPHRLRQILLNLLTNAVKFTPKGLIRITCRVEKDEEDNQEICLSVIDTGIGIEEEYLDRIFTKFSQEDKSTTRNYGGTGLGMFITRSLVELMGGTITVSSRKEIGTQVKINLSLQKGPAGVIRLPGKPERERREITGLKGLHVLVVDDNEMNRLVASTVLENQGITAREAVNGADAMRMLQQENFDLVLMDLQMPVMDGLEASRRIRQDLGLSLPIIALTASALNEESHRCLDAGMNDFIIKPFKEEEMVAVIHKAIRQQKETGERKVS